MYEKLSEQGINCSSVDIKCENCPYKEITYPFCMRKLISDLTEALMKIESYNAWNEEAAHHLKQKLDSIQLVELRR